VTPSRLAFVNCLQNVTADTCNGLTPAPNHTHNGWSRCACATIVEGQPGKANRGAEIRPRAHELWEAAGTEGQQNQFWFEAERELRQPDPALNLDEKSGTFTE
jgi:hypothetical protein